MTGRTWKTRWRALALAAAAALPALAQALCTSDDVARPAVLLERITSADCADCWVERTTPQAAANAIALDWVVPGLRGDDAPLAAVATDDALLRLAFLGQQPPARTAALTALREGRSPALRLAQGAAFNDYVGASIELKNPGREPWHTWLLLVEKLPAGTEGSPVERHLVRNVFRPDWSRPMSRRADRLAELRAMQIHEGAKPDRLRLVAVAHDAGGRLRAIAHTECRE
ncbi:MAG: hypothetical protein ACO1PB_16330 [Ramlibacter sp.]